MKNSKFLSNKEIIYILKDKKLPIPISIEWQLTYKCNANCIMCDMKLRDQKTEMKTKKIKKIIDELNELKTKVINFSGGEPLLRKDLFEIINYCKEKEINTILNTNAILITPNIVKKMQNSGLKSLNISMHYTNKKQDILRKSKNSFKKAIEGINYLKKITEQKIWINLNCVLMKTNLKEIKKFKNLHKKINFNSIKFSFVRKPKNNNTFKNYLNSVEKNIALKLIKELKKKSNSKFLIFKPTDIKFGSKKCASSKFMALIKPNGDVVPSCFCEDIILGNVNKQSFKKIWFGKKFNQIRKQTNNLKICEQCPQKLNNSLLKMIE